MTYIQPLVALILAGLIGAWIAVRRAPGARWLTVAVGALFAISWPPVAWLLSRPLENACPRGRFPEGNPGAIVALSGTVLNKDYGRPYYLASFDTFRRCEHAAWLYHSWRSLPVLVTGGSDGAGKPPFSETMRELLLRNGVPGDRIWTEDRSRSTWENAAFSARILREKGISSIALVVDARSMARAAACFRRQGIAVVPAASEFFDLGSGTEDWLPNWEGIEENETTLHETLGIGWYWLRGRI